MTVILSLEHVSAATLSSYSDVVLIPSDVNGMPSASRLRDALVRLHYPSVFFVAPSRAACTVATNDCVHYDRASMILGLVPRVLLAKTYAVWKFFDAGVDVLMLDSDVAILHPMAEVWHGELANTSLVVQEESPPHNLNSGMLRVQHVAGQAAASATVRWMLREWFRRVYTVGATAGCSGCDQPVLNELVHNLATGTTSFHSIAFPTLHSYPSSKWTKQLRASHQKSQAKLLDRLKRAALSHALSNAAPWPTAKLVGRRSAAATWLTLQPPSEGLKLNENVSNPSACISRRVCYPSVLKGTTTAYALSFELLPESAAAAGASEAMGDAQMAVASIALFGNWMKLHRGRLQALQTMDGGHAAAGQLGQHVCEPGRSVHLSGFDRKEHRQLLLEILSPTELTPPPTARLVSLSSRGWTRAMASSPAALEAAMLRLACAVRRANDDKRLTRGGGADWQLALPLIRLNGSVHRSELSVRQYIRHGSAVTVGCGAEALAVWLPAAKQARRAWSHVSLMGTLKAPTQQRRSFEHAAFEAEPVRLDAFEWETQLRGQLRSDSSSTGRGARILTIAVDEQNPGRQPGAGRGRLDDEIVSWPWSACAPTCSEAVTNTDVCAFLGGTEQP